MATLKYTTLEKLAIRMMRAFDDTKFYGKDETPSFLQNRKFGQRLTFIERLKVRWFIFTNKIIQ